MQISHIYSSIQNLTQYVAIIYDYNILSISKNDH